ncbi:hypothetical protein COCCADRAFT_99000 [Bipolaris zeicola 26-R-13]|uniref:Ubiquitin-like protease family profile domain-containing protein n=1 Tax=Cochliobolus carbonum (strain 26-R-13) TaxID=930089 RepID=W6YA53_COCC2|nr:uncharacterized protein COCCADRAFT_99000 [Bipolaris zeicola 26-R-13]EUC32319.1 hypothetical protein COCCADRAFT_99000 [Bipolaris zeicola 26-R-13]
MVEGIPKDVMNIQEEKTDERNPAQVTTQVAPSSLAPSSPLHVHAEPHTQIMTVANTQNACSDLGTPALVVDSPRGTEAHTQAQLQTHSPPVTEISLVSELEGCLEEKAQLHEDAPVPHTTSLTTPPSQDQDDKTTTTPPVTPPRGTQKIAKHARFELCKIYENTRHSMRYKTLKMFVIGSRGFERARLLPTRQTRPPLLKRRYSIDVNTTGDWGTCFAMNWKETEITCPRRQYISLDLEPIPILFHWSFIPHPRRYSAFSTMYQLSPPFDSNVYLKLGDITIQNDAFYHIRSTSWNHGEPWMRDESLDMALEVLCRDYNCENHRIAIANSMVSQICLFAAESEDSNPQEYAQYRARFETKQWIFLVINDAIGSVENNCLQGNHWSLIAMDRIHCTVSYYNSLFLDDEQSRHLGFQIGRGMLKILGEDVRNWRYRIQQYTPHQDHHNQFDYDDGACGPFVYKMAEVLIRRIKRHQSRGDEDECSLELSEDFPMDFKNQFHSFLVRCEIQRRIARWKAIIYTPTFAYDHDQEAIRGECVELDDSPVVNFGIPRRPETLVDWFISLENQNYNMLENSNDSDSSQGSCLSESTIVLALSPDPQEIYADGDTNHDQDEDRGGSILGLGITHEEPIPDGIQSTTNSPTPSTAEDDQEETAGLV